MAEKKVLYHIETCETIRDMMALRAENHPDREAFSYWDAGHTRQTRVTSREFAQQARALGTGLREVALPGRKIALLGENSYEWVLAFFAVTGMGATVVLLDKSQPPERLLELMRYTDCEGLIYSPSYRDVAEAAKETLPTAPLCTDAFAPALALGEERLAAGDTCFEDSGIDGDTVAAIAFTSGTTGRSKGVVLTHRNIASSTVISARHGNCGGRVLLMLPLHHMFGLTISMLVPFIWGASLYISPSLRYMSQDMAAVRPNLIFVIPAMYPMILRYVQAVGKAWPPQELPIRIFTGGAPVDPQWVERFRAFGAMLYNAYGITECAPSIASDSDLFRYCDGAMFPLQGLEVRLDMPGPDGVGEILVKGPNVFREYYKMPEETRAAFRDGWFCTGDLGRPVENGGLMITGRKKNLLVLGNGENVSAEEVETRVLSIEGVQECVASVRDGVLTIEIFPAEGMEDAVRAGVVQLNGTLPPFKRIAQTIFRETEFPKNSSGKILR